MVTIQELNQRMEDLHQKIDQIDQRLRLVAGLFEKILDTNDIKQIHDWCRLALDTVPMDFKRKN